MKLSETVYGDSRKALGKLTWNDAEGVARFTPTADGLGALRSMTWSCPIEARAAIWAHARLALAPSSA